MNSKVIGSMFMVTGTVIGAGMVAMPANSADVGFFATVGELVMYCFFMLFPALAIAEASQFAPTGVTVSGLMKKEFGNVGYHASNFLLYVFLYSLTCAYVSGISGIVAALLNIAEYKNYVLLGLIVPMGLMVVFTERVADLFNRVFFVAMLLAFVVLVLLGVGQVDLMKLGALPTSSLDFVKSLPIYFLAFGFHVIIPALVKYLDRDIKALRTALAGGIFLSLGISLLWNIVIHGLATREQLQAFRQAGEIDVGTLINASSTVQSVLAALVTTFTATAIMTSFIGVSLALVSTLRETFSHNVNEVSNVHSADNEVHIKTRLNGLMAFLLAFGLPVAVVILKPELFYGALAFAAVVFTVQGLCFPLWCTVANRVRRPEVFTEGTYRLALPNWFLILLSVVFLGIALTTVL